MVIDHNPMHIILRSKDDGSILRHRSGKFAYALVDFELLTRTPEYEQETQRTRRTKYLTHQRDRFTAATKMRQPPNLHHTRILDVDYVYGQAESTHGMLWVVGRDAELFDYFLPERWRHTPRKRLSSTTQSFYTLTKDKINLVWKLSRVGEEPDVDRNNGQTPEIVEYGYNSPFEQFAIAVELSQKGVPTTYPRAIYRSGLESARASQYAVDMSRFRSHSAITSTDGHAVPQPDHVYIAVWGFWNGLDEMLAQKDETYCRGINLDEALRQGIVTRDDIERLLRKTDTHLRKMGFQFLERTLTHFLVSVRPDNTVVEDEDGDPALRICNFELIRRIR